MKIILAVNKDFFPFPFSQNMSIEALPSIAVQEADMPWFYDLKETLEENKDNPHFDVNEYIRNNAKKAKSRGASAVILYNTSAIDDKLKFDSKDRTEKLMCQFCMLPKRQQKNILVIKQLHLILK